MVGMVVEATVEVTVVEMVVVAMVEKHGSELIIVCSD